MNPKPIKRIHILKWVKALRSDGIVISLKDKTIMLGSNVHPINSERVKELQYRNKFKAYQQLSLF